MISSGANVSCRVMIDVFVDGGGDEKAAVVLIVGGQVGAAAAQADPEG